MSELDPQTAFVRTLLEGGQGGQGVQGGEVPGLCGLRPGLSLADGLSAYRGNAQALSARALGAVFPQLQAVLGEADFAAMAWAFWRAHPPLRGDLGTWGDALAGFLNESAGLDSGLPALAQLEWALHEAERAADASLDADSLALLGQAELTALRLVLRPAVRVVALSGPVAGQPELAGACLVWREGWAGRHAPLDAGTAAFVRAVLAGESLGAALDSALDAAAVKGLAPATDFDFSAWLQAALRHEWLHRVVQHA